MVKFPQYDELKAELQKLREKISAAILEQDDLLLQQCRNIEAAYLVRFGGLEYAAYEAECKCRRYKRKLELVIMKRNRQEAIDSNALEKILDQEFEEYQHNLDEMVQNMNKALERSREKYLSEKDAALLKSMYRKIVKELHPDLHPDISEAKKELFFRAVTAYEEGNLELMRVIYDMVRGADLPDKEGSVLDYIEEKEQLTKKLEEILEKTEKIQTTYPYTLKEFLDDEDKARERTEELEKVLEMYRFQTEIYKEQIKDYMS